MPILDLIKSIRLEQVKKSYLNPHVPKGLKNFTKQQNALYYGFKNWTTFEKFYFTTFQESPDETIEKSSKDSVLLQIYLGGKDNEIRTLLIQITSSSQNLSMS
jgi:hypothetical protein